MTYKITDIKYDTDGQDVELPDTLEIEVPEDLKEYQEIEDFLSDEISNRTGWCHLGFNTIPEIPQE